uniref:B30.2/SPRY domain-containing protein n=1 Tax=Erpetoichthys calabaricus TaxID=27687 RepID=A0A8C4SX81_ERPCA
LLCVSAMNLQMRWTLLILLFLHNTDISWADSFIVVGPSKPVVTYVGEDVVLPASLSPALNAEAFEVRWFTTDIMTPELLYINYNISRQSDTRRTLSIDNLKNRNVSLIIRNVHVSDDHLYRCLVYSGQREEETQVSLTVEGQFLGAQPSISMSSTEGQKTRLECSAEKWKPQPEVTWRDMNGADVTSQSTIKSERDSEGLLRVSSVLLVKEEYNVFSCLMRSKAPKPDWHSGLGIYSTSLIVGLYEGHLKCKDILRRQKRKMKVNETDVTFDPETAHPELIVSEDGKEVRDTYTRQRVMDNPKRFDDCVCVLAREGFMSGRHYWEVEVGGKTAWALGVARESANRKEEFTVTPYNGYWTVWLSNENEYTAGIGRPFHLPLRVKPHTVGVFLDYDEGQVSFYNAQSRSHLYTFTDSFTEPLYPFFSPLCVFNLTFKEEFNKDGCVLHSTGMVFFSLCVTSLAGGQS